LHAEGRADKPRLQVVNVLRIDLNEPGISFVTTKSNGAEPLEVNGQTTAEFLKENKLQAAVNANFFSPVKNIDGDPKDLIGLSVSKGETVSPHTDKGAVLIISSKNKAKIADANSADVKDAYNGVQGNEILLSKGKIKVKEGGAVHPRTAAGISANGRYLYFIVIDGRQPGYSEGATMHETAEWLKRIGAADGLNLDGGGSTTMVQDDAKGGAKILNRPSGGVGEGGLRIVGNNIGVHAKK
jgi:exopolysaccharide biosynthesis protein